MFKETSLLDLTNSFVGFEVADSWHGNVQALILRPEQRERLFDLFKAADIKADPNGFWSGVFILTDERVPKDQILIVVLHDGYQGSLKALMSIANHVLTQFKNYKGEYGHAGLVDAS